MCILPSDPNMSRLDSILTRGETIRRSLNLGTKKDKPCRQQPLVSVAEGPAEEKTEEKAKEEEYTLPEIPHTPLSGTCLIPHVEITGSGNVKL